MKIRSHISIIILTFALLTWQVKTAYGFIDVGVTAILQPTCPVVPGTLQTVIVVITNFGTTSITTVPVSYILNGGIPVTATYNGFLAPSTSDTFEIIPVFIVPSGPFSLCSYTDGDSNPANDTTCICNPLSTNSDLDYSKNHLIINPNPTSGLVSLKLFDLTSMNTTISITDLLGRNVLESDFIKPEIDVDLSNEPNGLYLIILKTPYTVSTSKLFVIK